MMLLQFLLDVFWFGNGCLLYSMVAIYLGILFSFMIVLIAKSSGDFDCIPQPIDSLNADKNGITMGTISTVDPFIWQDKQYAYFLNKETNRDASKGQHPDPQG